MTPWLLSGRGLFRRGFVSTNRVSHGGRGYNRKVRKLGVGAERALGASGAGHCRTDSVVVRQESLTGTGVARTGCPRARPVPAVGRLTGWRSRTDRTQRIHACKLIDLLE